MLFPAFFWGLLRTETRPKLRLAVLVLVGLSFNVHPLSAAICAAAIAVYVLYTCGATWASGKQVAVLVLAFVLSAAPSAIRYSRARSHEEVRGEEAVQVNDIMRHRFPFLFLDTGAFRLAHIGGWLWLTTALGIALKARTRRLDSRDGGLLAAGLAALAIALLGTALFSYVSDRLRVPRIMPYSLRWAKLIFLVHYVFLAQLGAALFLLAKRLDGGGRSRIAGACASLLVLALIADAGAAGVRAWRTGHRTPTQDEAALARLAAWARANTPRDALFHFDNLEFRLEARRGLTVCWKDGGTFSHSDPRKLIEWWRRYEQQQQALASGSPSKVVGLARRLGADYLVLPGFAQAARLPVAYRNDWFVVYAL